MEVKAYTRNKTVTKQVEVKVEVPYIGVHLTPEEAGELHHWLKVNIAPFNTGMNRLPRQLMAALDLELK